MVTKDEKLARARQLIAAAPEASRRAIADLLRQELGEGLRDAVILSLQRQAYPERRRIIVEPYQLNRPVEGRYKPLREGRYNKLVKWNFSAKEARKMSRLPLTMLPFIKDMANARKKIVDLLNNQGRQLGWSKAKTKAELKDLLDYTYTDSGWMDKEGEKDIWAMLRHFRGDAIDRGEYKPRPRKVQSPHRRATYRETHGAVIKAYAGDYRRERKEQIKAYASDYRHKQKEKSKR